jgi:hypothetical protein
MAMQFMNLSDLILIGSVHISDENSIVSKTDERRCFAFAIFICGSKLDPKATINFVMSNIKQNY